MQLRSSSNQNQKVNSSCSLQLWCYYKRLFCIKGIYIKTYRTMEDLLSDWKMIIFILCLWLAAFKSHLFLRIRRILPPRKSGISKKEKMIGRLRFIEETSLKGSIRCDSGGTLSYRCTHGCFILSGGKNVLLS